MRKDNDLLILAKQGLSELKSWNPCLDRVEQRKSHRSPQKPLQGEFRDYLTGLEPSGELIEYWESSFFKHQQINLDKFRQDCEVIDNE